MSIYRHTHTHTHTHTHSPHKRFWNQLYMMQHICYSRLQESHYTLTGQWVDIEETERLWSWNARCLDLQRWRETITFVQTVSIATFLSLFSFYFFWGGRKPLSAASCNNSRHLLLPDDVPTETQGGKQILCVCVYVCVCVCVMGNRHRTHTSNVRGRLHLVFHDCKKREVRATWKQKGWKL